MFSGISAFVFQTSSPILENEECTHCDQCETDRMIPAKRLAQIEDGETAKYDQRHHFLDRLELGCRIDLGAKTICGSREAIFNESNAPTRKDCEEDGRGLVFQMPIPSECHEDIGGKKHQSGRKRRRECGHGFLPGSLSNRIAVCK